MIINVLVSTEKALQEVEAKYQQVFATVIRHVYGNSAMGDAKFQPNENVVLLCMPHTFAKPEDIHGKMRRIAKVFDLGVDVYTPYLATGWVNADNELIGLKLIKGDKLGL